MKHRSTEPLPPRLLKGRERLEHWRSEQKPRTRLPEHLWAMATELAQDCGLHRTAKTLRLDYYALKKRLERLTIGEVSAAPDKPSFLELRPVEATPDPECTVVCQNTAGTQIRIHLKGHRLPDLTELCGELWSRMR